MAQRLRSMTADGYFSLPEQPHTQLIDGELIVDAPVLRHQRVVDHLNVELHLWARTGPGRGEVVGGPGVHLDDANVLVPDVVWVAEARRPGRGDKRFVGSPDLVVEVCSPATWRFDTGTKRRHYEAAGTAELWLVDTLADQVRVLRRSVPEASGFDVEVVLDRTATLTTPLLDGFALDLAALFDR
ncbi:hypothetical protein BH24ACT3_BH24ACT3_11220 [soil metagenome]